jgi:acetyl/propionyl-CoA carboxylase alpha subunit
LNGGFLKRLVISNRGEIARRILRAGRARGYEVAVISVSSDFDAVVRREADAVLEVPSFLDMHAIVAAAKKWNADFVHPGYGFLSENPEFARHVELAGMIFVGPTAENMHNLGPKEAAKQFAMLCNVPTLPALWSETFANLHVQSWSLALDNAGLSLPYLVKASFGGGGRGLRVARSVEELSSLVERARAEAASGFGDGRVFVEQFLENARHIEVQIFGNGNGHAVAIGDRECSIQRRYQKIVEEAPAPNLSSEIRQRLHACSVAIAREARYRGAGTVEFLVDTLGYFFFLEVNTRIQVEHTVTEIAFGIDLVQAQFDLAEGSWPSQIDNLEPAGTHAIEARVAAEDPKHEFIPTPGLIARYREPRMPAVRIDSGVVEGSRIHPDFDSLVAKIIAAGSTREEARKRLLLAIENTVIHGFETNLAFLTSTLCHHDFVSGNIHTRWVEENMSTLTRPLIPKPLRDFFTSAAFCEQLTLALCGGLPSQGGAFAQKFASLGNSQLKIGSSLEEEPWFLEVIDASTGTFSVHGTGLVSAILKARAELSTLPQVFHNLHAQAIQSPESTRLRFVGTRISQTQMTVSFLGDSLNIESSRHRARPQTQAITVKREIVAPLAGKVTSACVKPGCQVKLGQLLFVVESMKMQFDIRAEHDAIIDSVLAVEGQVLTGSSVLATLKSPSESIGG